MHILKGIVKYCINISSRIHYNIFIIIVKHYAVTHCKNFNIYNKTKHYYVFTLKGKAKNNLLQRFILPFQRIRNRCLFHRKQRQSAKKRTAAASIKKYFNSIICYILLYTISPLTIVISILVFLIFSASISYRSFSVTAKSAFLPSSTVPFSFSV